MGGGPPHSTCSKGHPGPTAGRCTYTVYNTISLHEIVAVTAGKTVNENGFEIAYSYTTGVKDVESASVELKTSWKVTFMQDDAYHTNSVRMNEIKLKLLAVNFH